MGAGRSKTRAVGESAREVLTRRKAVVDGKTSVIKVDGSANIKKPVFSDFHSDAMDEMSKVLKVETTVGKSVKTKPDGSHVAQVIRYHRDNKAEINMEKGIVEGRVQLREAELMEVFSAFRADHATVSEISQDLNISIEECLALLRSARLPKYSQIKGEDIAF